MIYLKTFGETLTEAREKQNLTQKRLAEILGITPTRLNYWEKDKREPNIEMMKQIAAALNIPIAELLNWEEFDKEHPNMGEEVAEFEEFKTFLESIGYIVKFVPAGEEGESFTAELIKDGKKTEFPKAEFENFKLETKKTVDYQVWQKSQEKK